MGLQEEEDIEFWTYMLQYWYQTPIDELELWTSSQIEYQKEHGNIELEN
jgi:hypothetical protein